jgi:hypothetical protein
VREIGSLSSFHCTLINGYASSLPSHGTNCTPILSLGRLEVNFSACLQRLRAGSGSKSFASSVADILVEDQDATNPDKIKKVFCSQSVVLMLRHALDPEGRHAGLLATLNQLNSRLVSPKQMDIILRDYGAVPLSNEELSSL